MKWSSALQPLTHLRAGGTLFSRSKHWILTPDLTLGVAGILQPPASAGWQVLPAGVEPGSVEQDLSEVQAAGGLLSSEGLCSWSAFPW